MDKNEILDFFKDLIVIVVIVLVIRTFLAMPFQISWQSMYSSYYDKEFIIVDRLSYYLWDPDRGDVVVFKPHISKDRVYFLKRILWVPWDKIKIENGEVYLWKKWDFGYKMLDETYLNEENRWYTYVNWSKEKFEYALKENDYFVLWDNRNHSTDSRECFSSCSMSWNSNFIWKADITWRLFLDLWYFNFKAFDFIQPRLWIDTKPRFFDTVSTYEY